MEILNTLDTIYTDRPTALAIGKFDGVHAGHRRLLAHIIEAKADGLTPCVFTFEPSPERFFGGMDKKLIISRDEKRDILKSLGVELLVEYPLNKESAAVDPAVFVTDILCRRLKAALIVAGADLSFGKGGKGDFVLLNALSRDHGFETVEVDKLMYNNAAVSSSRIREMIARGDMISTLRCLGSPYSFTAAVEHGAALGRTIGFPTINMTPDPDKILPPFGVYECGMMIDGTYHKGVCNIGVKPTVKNDDRVCLETYLIDFSQDVYGRKLCVELLRFVRPEQRFDSVEDLKAQMQRDLLSVRY